MGDSSESELIIRGRGEINIRVYPLTLRADPKAANKANGRSSLKSKQASSDTPELMASLFKGAFQRARALFHSISNAHKHVDSLSLAVHRYR